jgi:hypothetical protein
MNKKSFPVAREALKLQAPIYNSQLLEIKVGGQINEIKLKLLNGKF